MGRVVSIISYSNGEVWQVLLRSLAHNLGYHEKQRHTSNNKETFQPRHRQCIYLCVLWSFLSLNQFDIFYCALVGLRLAILD